jgi:branched-chain amino acid transport system permease protein
LVLGGVVGLIVGIPALRLTGLYLMLTTLALQFIVSFLGQNAQGTVYEAGYIVKPPQWGSLVLSNYRPLFVITVVVLGLVLLALNGMYSGVPGRAWAALRQNEFGASVMGINVTRWKLAAYVGSSALTAVGGSLYAYQTGAVGYDSFSLDLSLALLIMVFVGGIGTKIGPLIGAGAIVILPKLLQQLSSVFAANVTVSTWLNTNEAFLSSAIYGAALLILLLFERDGLFGVGRRLCYLVIRMVRALLSLRRGTEVS